MTFISIAFDTRPSTVLTSYIRKKLDIQIFNEVNTIISANFPLNLFCASRRPVHSNPAVVASLSAVPVRRISCNIVRYSCMLSARSVCLSVNYTKRFFSLLLGRSHRTENQKSLQRPRILFRKQHIESERSSFVLSSRWRSRTLMST